MCPFVDAAFLRSGLWRTADHSRQASRLSPAHSDQRATASLDVLSRGILEEGHDHILDGFAVWLRRIILSAADDGQARADR
jgi:hypothetical protein